VVPAFHDARSPVFWTANQRVASPGGCWIDVGASVRFGPGTMSNLTADVLGGRGGGLHVAFVGRVSRPNGARTGPSGPRSVGASPPPPLSPASPSAPASLGGAALTSVSSAHAAAPEAATSAAPIAIASFRPYGIRRSYTRQGPAATRRHVSD